MSGSLQAQIDALGTRVSDAASVASSAQSGVTALEKKTANSLDTGSIFSVAYGYSKTITGALPCTGGLYSPTAYPNLFNTIGYNYGGGCSSLPTFSFSYGMTLYTRDVFAEPTGQYIYTLATPTSTGTSWYVSKYQVNGTRISTYAVALTYTGAAAIVGASGNMVVVRGGVSNAFDYKYSLNGGETFSDFPLNGSNTTYAYLAYFLSCTTGVAGIIAIGGNSHRGSFVPSNGGTRKSIEFGNVMSFVGFTNSNSDTAFIIYRRANDNVPQVYCVNPSTANMLVLPGSYSGNLSGAVGWAGTDGYYITCGGSTNVFYISKSLSTISIYGTLQYLFTKSDFYPINDSQYAITYTYGNVISFGNGCVMVAGNWYYNANNQYNAKLVINLKECIASLVTFPDSTFAPGCQNLSELNYLYFYNGSTVNRISPGGLLFKTPKYEDLFHENYVMT